MVLAWYIPFTKLLFINICVIYGLLKISGNKVNKIREIISILLFVIVFSSIYVVLKSNLDALTSYFIYYFLLWITLFMIKSFKFLNSITIVTVSISITLVSLFIATAIYFIIMLLLKQNMENYSLVECLNIGIVQFILITLFYKIKRFKNGISFLIADYRFVNIVAIIVGLAIISISIRLGIYANSVLETILILVLIFGGIYLFYWIKKNITKHYKQKMKDRTVEILEDSIKEKDEEINELKDELSKALEINHKYNHRLSAMEKAVASLGDAPSFNEEFAKEYSDVLDSLKEFSEEYKKEVELLNKHDELPKTKIFSIDNLLEYMKSEAENNKIEFKLEVNIDVNELINSKIEKCKLETMLADHIRDAIIAIISNEKANNGRIKVIFDKIEECFEVHVLDNGIEFEINTLLKLGLKPVTTHKISGGSGIGFMTTFNTLDDTKASLIIREFDASKEQDYTKDIVIRFDEKNEYVIESYRSEEIKIKDKENRIIIKEI